MKREIIRIVYCSIFIDGEWNKRSNKEIDDVLGHENIIGFIKALRIRWFGHIEIMGKERMSKMILNSKIDSGRKRVRSRKRWIDDLESILRSLGIRN